MSFHTYFRELTYTAFLRSRGMSTPGAMVRAWAVGEVVMPGA